MTGTFDYKIIKIVNLQVKYELFFEEEPNGKQSKFVEKLEEQDQQEKMEYIRQIKGQFRFFFRPYFAGHLIYSHIAFVIKTKACEKLRKLQLEGTDDITSAEAKIAFMSIDPGINVEIINKYLSVSQTA